ncbi:hypothetical protein H0H93_007727 [Arthromyces matolae]|nr:hypothetical protein H0H93_007727 [Arthromyces matolae]
MAKVYRFTLSLAALFSFILIPAFAAATARNKQSHSLGNNYKFDPRDGWQRMEATDLAYKYHGNSTSTHNHAHAQKRNDLSNHLGLGDKIKDTISKVWKGMKAFGPTDSVIITWYTGHDLKNPSCWAQGDWAPTDKSFACATTLYGWYDRPKCFDFLELCNGPNKCVFVRVVDTCAGCKEGSHHIDLTRAAFEGLATLDQGKLMNIHCRKATPPETWHEDLWGPKRLGKHLGQ